jgi:hypothetical protein
MRKFFIVFLALSILFFGPGCKRIKKIKEVLLPTPERKLAIKPVESIELAQAIVWPKPHHFSLTRDPFRPLIGAPPAVIPGEIELIDISNIRISGIAVGKGRPVVLLELPEGTNIFHEQDKLDKYTIKKIEPKRVILEAENKSFILEIGEEK